MRAIETITGRVSVLNRDGEVSFLAPAVIVFPSIGSPETDRGPPAPLKIA